MTIRCWLVSRHPGAIEWLSKQEFTITDMVEHLEVNEVASGDIVIGTLPIQLAAEVCSRGAHYHHLSLTIPSCLRGQELDMDQMNRCNACLETYLITKLDT